jgi:hypothetical protein
MNDMPNGGKDQSLSDQLISLIVGPLEQAIADAEAAASEYAASLASQIRDGVRTAESPIDQAIGSVILDIDGALVPIEKAIKRTIDSVGEWIGTAALELASAGIDWPWLPYDQSSALQGDMVQEVLVRGKVLTPEQIASLGEMVDQSDSGAIVSPDGTITYTTNGLPITGPTTPTVPPPDTGPAPGGEDVITLPTEPAPGPTPTIPPPAPTVTCPDGYEPTGRSQVWIWTGIPTFWRPGPGAVLLNVEEGEITSEPTRAGAYDGEIVTTPICRPIKLTEPPKPPEGTPTPYPPQTCPTPPPTCPAPQVICPPAPPITVQVPPPPPPPPPPPEPGTIVGTPDKTFTPSGPFYWGRPDICQNIDEHINKFVITSEPTSFDKLYTKTDSFVGQFVDWFASTLAKQVTAAAPEWQLLGGPIRDSLMAAAGSAMADRLLRGQAYVGQPGYFEARSFGTIVSQAKMVESWSGFPLPYLTQDAMYAVQYLVPQYLPTQPEIDTLRITDRIDKSTWECLTRAQGNLPNWRDKVVDAQRPRPGLSELIQLYLRNPDPDAWDTLIKRSSEIGWGDPQYVAEMVRLSFQLPTLTDQIRFLVRDVWDKGIVERYQYDQDFDTKFTEQAQALAKASGVDPQWLRAAWRAHWEIPSPTALYRMLHRLRPERPSVIRWDDYASRFGEDNARLQFGDRPTVVTRADVETALKVNDMAPAWVDAMVDISYDPITRTDAVRAHEIGSFSDDDLYNAMRDNGYNDSDAKTLVRFYAQNKARKISNSTGALTIRKITKYYKEGAIDREQALAFLEPLISNAVDRVGLIQRVDDEMVAEVRALQNKAIRKQFLLGEIAEAEATATLVSSGLTPTQAGLITQKWAAELAIKYKELTVRMLCPMFDRGIITAEQYHERLIRIGYSLTDANRLLALCNVQHRERLEKLAKQTAKEAATELRRIAALQEKSQKQLNAMLKQLDEQRRRVEAELERRQKEAAAAAGESQQPAEAESEGGETD